MLGSLCVVLPEPANNLFSSERHCIGLQVDVSSREEVLRVMEIGARNRAVAETKMNERSSRSHSVLTVIVDGISHVTGQRTHGCLHLIDLAGQQSPFWCLYYAARMSTALMEDVAWVEHEVTPPWIIQSTEATRPRKDTREMDLWKAQWCMGAH